MTASRSLFSTRRLVASAGAALIVGAVGFFAWASPGPQASEANASASAEAEAAARFEWTYGYAGGDKGRAAIEDAVDEAIKDMNGLIRGIARRKILEANAVVGKMGFSLGGDPLRASYVGGRLVESPANGLDVDWVDQFGDTVKVRQRWSGRKLVQHFHDDKGSRTNVYRFSEDGKRMTMSVTIKASRLPAPIHYRLTYRKKGS